MSKIIVEIDDAETKSEVKFEKAIQTLYKAMNFDTHNKEVSAYRSVRDLERISKHRVEKLLHKLYISIIRQWVVVVKSKDDDIFRLNGNVYLNPKTGKPLTNKEWKILKTNITNAFDYIYKDEEDRIALKALALGKVLKRMDTEFAVNASWDSLAPKVTATEKTLKGDTWENIKTFADQHAGELIVDLSNKQYKQIHDVIQTAIRNKVSGNELQSKLFDTFGSWNRDWRRIAETEISAAQNNGMFQTMLDDNGDEPTFLKGVSAPDACQACQRLINNKIFVLLPSPPESGGDQVTVNGETYTAIWVGKSNYGRSRANWWAAFPMHPHCLLPDQKVSAFLPSWIMQSRYKGRIVKITFGSGRNISVTENHPILTPNGFVSAKFLSVGDYIVSTSDSKRVLQSIYPYYNQRETTIENLFRTAQHTSSVPSIRVPVSSKDFYGDGRFINGEVTVVNAYSLLGSYMETLLLEHSKQQLFCSIKNSFGLILGSSINELGNRCMQSSFSNVGSSGELFPNTWRRVFHSDIHGFRTISNMDIGFYESISNNIPVYTELSRKFLNRFSINITTDKQIDSFLFNDKITHISFSNYDGFVYDITDDIYGLYIDNGVIVKNCRCTAVEHIPGFEKYEAMLRDSMNKGLTEQ